MSQDENLGNEIKFPTDEKNSGKTGDAGAELPASSIFSKLKTRYSKVNLTPIYLKGWAVIFGVIMGNRCLFFINADYAVGELKYAVHRYSHTLSGGRYNYPIVSFKTKDGIDVFFSAGENLDLDNEEQLKVIYKKNEPQRAFVFSFFGFWFRPLLICGVLSLFWLGIPLVWYGYKD